MSSVPLFAGRNIGDIRYLDEGSMLAVYTKYNMSKNILQDSHSQCPPVRTSSLDEVGNVSGHCQLVGGFDSLRKVVPRTFMNSQTHIRLERRLFHILVPIRVFQFQSPLTTGASMGFLPWHWLLLALTHGGLSCSWASNSPIPAVAVPSLLKSFDPSIRWYIEQQNVSTNDRVHTGGAIQGRKIKTSSSDPYVSYASTSHLTKEETFMFTWELCMYNCSQDPTTGHETVGNHDARLRQLYFSIKNNTSPPDFVAATEDNTSNKVASSGFTLDMRRTPSPCKVKIDSSDAVSISAALASVACASRAAQGWAAQAHHLRVHLLPPNR
ncbi:uncharacterized protein BDW43DRAFT_310571 [Aspergillus alliaceus]|uniref:uncharacterized protein n=1 Tax=Petromyces alliaceus TaxID=209559 RepID=UPI0012A697C7|nr:uncharacterized protein BDW43DRAFT_310571 [Aspergillus alliaceus]KAB8234217.1 hypothetical protein BDW43DRAFT_310571 [Aspergillus alliaceus]